MINLFAGILGACVVLVILLAGNLFQTVTNTYSGFSYSSYNTGLAVSGIVSSIIIWAILHALGSIAEGIYETNSKLTTIQKEIGHLSSLIYFLPEQQVTGESDEKQEQEEPEKQDDKYAMFRNPYKRPKSIDGE